MLSIAVQSIPSLRTALRSPNSEKMLEQQDDTGRAQDKVAPLRGNLLHIEECKLIKAS